MQIDCDYYTARGEELPCKYRNYLTNDLVYLELNKNQEFSVLRMYGVTEAGNSVMAHVHNFLSYFYIELTNEGQAHNFTKDDLDQVKTNLNMKLGSLQGVVHIEVVKKASVMYFQEKLVNFLKVYVHLPSSVSKAR